MKFEEPGALYRESGCGTQGIDEVRRVEAVDVTVSLAVLGVAQECAY
jgi:hypothetical protein